MAASNWPDAIAVQGPSGGGPVNNPVVVQPVDANNVQVVFNKSSTPLPGSAGTTSTRTSSDIANASARGLMIRVNLANLSGAPTFTPTLDWKDNDSNYTMIWQAAAALNANGSFTYLLYPGAAAGSGAQFTGISGITIPRVFRLRLVYAGNGTTDKADTTVETELIM